MLFIEGECSGAALFGYFLLLQGKSDSPVGATKSDGIGFERVLLRGPKGEAHGRASYYPLPRYSRGDEGQQRSKARHWIPDRNILG